tara:strand:+ start:1341 stop:1502 length:162 start_codon:yes stop_codon:yes gene_type:complete
MQEKNTDSQTKSGKEDRAKRLESALRANLRRRKGAAKKISAPAADAPNATTDT